MVKVLKDIDDNTKKAIHVCLSSSQKCGHELREAHYYLGKKVGHEIVKGSLVSKKKVAVLIMMRAGLPFGLGVADAIEDNNKVEILFSYLDNDFSEFDVVIIADAVINTGKTICKIGEKISKEVIVATNVISSKYIDNLNEYDVFATRISDNSYRGIKTKNVSNGKGPDTGDRLFDNSFFK